MLDIDPMGSNRESSFDQGDPREVLVGQKRQTVRLNPIELNDEGGERACSG